MISAATENAIEQLYQAFSKEPKPRKIEACPCCISEGELKELTSTPLRKLTASQLSNYAESVFLTSGSEADFRYLLPRILEISIRNGFDWPDREVVFRSLKLGNWQAWQQPLKDSILGVLLSGWKHAVAYNDGEDVDQWVCSLSRAGLDTLPYLKILEQSGNEKALLTFYESNSQALMKGKLGNSFWDGKADCKSVIEWFRSPKVQEKLNNLYKV